jgi:hypothetical protein
MYGSPADNFLFAPRGDDIVKHPFVTKAKSSRIAGSRTGNCHNLLMTSRVRREALAKKMEKQWHELLLHATIESDPQKMLWLTAELDLRKCRVAGSKPEQRQLLDT